MIGRTNVSGTVANVYAVIKTSAGNTVTIGNKTLTAVSDYVVFPLPSIGSYTCVVTDASGASTTETLTFTEKGQVIYKAIYSLVDYTKWETVGKKASSTATTAGVAPTLTGDSTYVMGSQDTGTGYIYYKEPLDLSDKTHVKMTGTFYVDTNLARLSFAFRNDVTADYIYSAPIDIMSMGIKKSATFTSFEADFSDIGSDCDRTSVYICIVIGTKCSAKIESIEFT